MINYSFRILNEDKKQIEIKYKGETLRFQLKQKRSFTVLKKLLEAYPNFINIHSLDSTLNDPNRAHSDLRITNGFANFLVEERRERQVMYVKINIPDLFRSCRQPRTGEFLQLSPSDTRESLSSNDRTGIYERFGGKCNITGIKVYDTIEGSKFFKSLILARYDHRRPLSKRGSNDLDNWQLLSKLANDEKNKICNTCDGERCEQCALAYPEKFNVIQPNNQDISDLRMRLL